MQTLTYTDGIRSLSNVYSPSFLREIINKCDLSKVQTKKTKYQKIVLGNNKALRFYEFLELLYKEMFKNYRNEYLFKNAIVNKLLLGKYSINTTTLLNEFKIGKAIADTILINGEVQLFEIKTDLDRLHRLDQQLKEYQKAVEKIYIVADPKNIYQLKEKYTNEPYGLIEFTSNNILRHHKDAAEDTDYLDHETLFKLLRKEEYLRIISEYFKYQPNVPNTKIFRECLAIIKNINVRKFQKMVFKIIKERNIKHPNLLLDPRVPDELKLLCYTLDLSQEQYTNLFNLLKQKI
jgi:hypothetical protein